MNMAVRLADYKAGESNGARRSRRRHFRNGVCAAALRAMSATRTYLGEGVTLEEAAARHGTCVAYVQAGVTLTKAGDQFLIRRVMWGDIPILKAAKMVEPLVQMLDGYSKATPDNKDAFFAATGCTNDLGQHLVASTLEQRIKAASRLETAQVWDSMINPLLEAAE